MDAFSIAQLLANQDPANPIKLRYGTVTALNTNGTLSVIPDGQTQAVSVIKCCRPKVGSRVVVLVNDTEWLAVSVIGGDQIGTDGLVDGAVTPAKLSAEVMTPVLMGTFAPSPSGATRTLSTGYKFSDYKKVMVVGSGYGNKLYVETYVSLFSVAGTYWYGTIPAGTSTYEVRARYINDTQLDIRTGSDINEDVKVYGIRG